MSNSYRFAPFLNFKKKKGIQQLVRVGVSSEAQGEDSNVREGDWELLLLLLLPLSLISSIILQTTAIFGRSFGSRETQRNAIWSKATISSSISLQPHNSTSNTSEVHSSCTTVCTHFGRSTIPSSVDLPVRISSKTTPKLYTSEFWFEYSSGCEVRWRREKSEISALKLESTRMLEEVRCWWEMLNLDAPCKYARPRAASSASFSRVDQLMGILPGPLFPVTVREFSWKKPSVQFSRGLFVSSTLLSWSSFFFAKCYQYRKHWYKQTYRAIYHRGFRLV